MTDNTAGGVPPNDDSLAERASPAARPTRLTATAFIAYWHNTADHERKINGRLVIGSIDEYGREKM